MKKIGKHNLNFFPSITEHLSQGARGAEKIQGLFLFRQQRRIQLFMFGAMMIKLNVAFKLQLRV